MFSILHQYQNTVGAIKFSSATNNAHFKNKTSGLAIKYVSKGREDYLVGENNLQVEAGQFVILRQEQRYEARSKGKRTVTEGICIDLHSKLFLEDARELLFELPFQGTSFLKLSQSLRQFSGKRTIDGPGWDDLFKQINDDFHSFSTLIGQLAPFIRFNAKKPNTQKQLLLCLFRAKDFIHQHYDQPLKLKAISQYAGISQYYLSRLFQGCFQQSPRELQLDLRMKEAMRRINDEHQSLSDIAFQLGYSDLAAFSNQFKKYYRQSPSAARKDLN